MTAGPKQMQAYKPMLLRVHVVKEILCFRSEKIFVTICKCTVPITVYFVTCVCSMFRNGEEWHKQRSPISKFMSVPRKVAEYYESFNEVSADLIKSIRRSRTEAGMLVDAPSYLHKWAFECKYTFVSCKNSPYLTIFFYVVCCLATLI